MWGMPATHGTATGEAGKLLLQRLLYEVNLNFGMSLFLENLKQFTVICDVNQAVVFLMGCIGFCICECL